MNRDYFHNWRLAVECGSWLGSFSDYLETYATFDDLSFYKNMNGEK